MEAPATSGAFGGDEAFRIAAHIAEAGAGKDPSTQQPVHEIVSWLPALQAGLHPGGDRGVLGPDEPRVQAGPGEELMQAPVFGLAKGRTAIPCRGQVVQGPGIPQQPDDSGRDAFGVRKEHPGL